MRTRMVILFQVLLSFSVLLLLAKISLKLSDRRPVIQTERPKPARKSVTLHHKAFTYHLNISQFQREFPHLQSYECSLLHTPHQEIGRTSPLLIMAIKSHPASVSRRSALRTTWAKNGQVLGFRVWPLFLMAVSDDAKHMEIVKMEKNEYGDIILWDFTEGHHNLSLKERCFLEWLYDNPTQVAFIFKGDDDVFVNPSSLVHFIKERASSPTTLYGALHTHSNVFRSTKYKVSESLFPYPVYPYFLSGGGFLFPGASVKLLYRASLELPVFPLDDVYFGFLSLASNLTLLHDSRFHVFGLGYNPCDYQRAFVVHGIGPDDLLKIWREVQEAQCNNPAPK
ncbi:UDP-GlcNAc:betaGal beta-1,3-N-acetylglucosaminyltransferase 9-like [Engystomops pustulosus]|uniref:UDP-GlcNAc:betaGal beta-1,3-N-acetylglucosaminyltransferase 9-like n=1 Tax=Engystomops pustulosus TaxID=76066 RepID=UPI003AFB1CCA